MTIRLFRVTKILILLMILSMGGLSCSKQTSKESSDNQQASTTENIGCKSQDWDIERINAYYNQHSPLSESDYDFLLDQLEILGNRRDSMTPEEFKAYFDGFNEKEASAYMFLAMNPAEANMKGKLTPVQSKRFNSLKHYLD